MAKKRQRSATEAQSVYLNVFLMLDFLKWCNEDRPVCSTIEKSTTETTEDSAIRRIKKASGNGKEITQRILMLEAGLGNYPLSRFIKQPLARGTLTVLTKVLQDFGEFFPPLHEEEFVLQKEAWEAQRERWFSDPNRGRAKKRSRTTSIEADERESVPAENALASPSHETEDTSTPTASQQKECSERITRSLNKSANPGLMWRLGIPLGLLLVFFWAGWGAGLDGSSERQLTKENEDNSKPFSRKTNPVTREFRLDRSRFQVDANFLESGNLEAFVDIKDEILHPYTNTENSRRREILAHHDAELGFILFYDSKPKRISVPSDSFTFEYSGGNALVFLHFVGSDKSVVRGNNTLSNQTIVKIERPLSDTVDFVVAAVVFPLDNTRDNLGALTLRPVYK